MKNVTIIKLIFLCCMVLTFASCRTTESIYYLQDVEPGVPEHINNQQSIIIQPKDMLSIIVSSKDPELAAMFNLTVRNNRAGAEEQIIDNQYLSGYVVDTNGDIDFPVLGKIHAAGLSRWQLQDTISSLLISKDLLKDPIVIIEFMNFKVSILGEVKRPGTYTINGDKVTILEAIALAGDLTIYGVRDNVSVIREENGKRHTYRVDLRSSKLFDSPAYYLRQNDVIYVAPNKVRTGQSTLNQNQVKSISLWLSLSSVLTSIAIVIVNVIQMNKH